MISPLKKEVGGGGNVKKVCIYPYHHAAEIEKVRPKLGIDLLVGFAMSVVMTHKVPCYQLGTSLHVRGNFIEKMGGIYIVACG